MTFKTDDWQLTNFVIIWGHGTVVTQPNMVPMTTNGMMGNDINIRCPVFLSPRNKHCLVISYFGKLSKSIGIMTSVNSTWYNESKKQTRVHVLYDIQYT